MTTRRPGNRPRRRRLALLTAGLLTSLTLQFGVAPATADPFPITLVSRGVSGAPANNPSFDAAISTSRYVAFISRATNLVPDDGNGQYDVFVRDMLSGTTTRASVSTTGGDPDNDSFAPSISADGRYVAFSTRASNLVTDDGNQTFDVFAHDLTAGTTVRVSVDRTGGDAQGRSNLPSISANGRYVAFVSDAPDLVPGAGTGTRDVYVRDLVAGTTTRVSVDATGGAANAESSNPSISGHGRYVAFESSASDLVADDTNGVADIFVRDLVTGITTRANVDTAGGDADGFSFDPSISANGRYVAFDSSAPDLVADDLNGFQDVFVRDLMTGTTTRLSVDAAGSDADGGSVAPSMSGDGLHFAFVSNASDLVPGDGNGRNDIFVRDALAGTTIRVTVDTSGGDPNDQSDAPSISYGGTFVAFESFASDLVPDDFQGVPDIFRRRLR